MKQIETFSFGVGDRFGHQGEAQLAAFEKAAAAGVDIVPVWNKSYREHSIIHTKPADVRTEADAAVQARGWQKSHYVDADHINLSNVADFLDVSDFFTIDVAESIGAEVDEASIETFVQTHRGLAGSVEIEGLGEPLEISEDYLRTFAAGYLKAMLEAKAIYEHIAGTKGDAFVTEVSTDEAETPQSPQELFMILATLAELEVPVQTIAPKFTGRFNKGVDYVGDLAQFEKEFNEDLAVIRFAVKEFGLPSNLKLSVHSGSDKFAIYEPIRRALQAYEAGLHIKTAGTTWLEELIGLAAAGGEGLNMAREVYAQAFGRYDELCGPYATVIDINRAALPSPEEVSGWSGLQYAQALRHVEGAPGYDPNLRQLLHVGYKVAAEMGDTYLDALKANADVIAEGVTENIFDRHMQPLFL